VLIKVVLPVVTGALLASLTMFGLVYSETKTPDKNPSDAAVLTYGNR
jgi:hypothetical protein